jgi:hypothetical protein
MEEAKRTARLECPGGKLHVPADTPYARETLFDQERHSTITVYPPGASRAKEDATPATRAPQLAPPPPSGGASPGRASSQTVAFGQYLSRRSHLVVCPHCELIFDLFAAAWCVHQVAQRSKVCPRCGRCVCDHPGYSDPRLWTEAPFGFRKQGFERLCLLYL